MNIKLTIQYDGTNYHGYQIQPNGITVQEVLENTLSKITNEEIHVVGCGRTDAGVHALGFVGNFNTTSKIAPENFANALNALLPDDIRCLKSELVSDEFHSKKSAIKKTYIYKIHNAPIGDAFLRNYTWHYKYPLDVKKMQQAAKYFVGEHDFKTFVAAGFSAKTTVRKIFDLDVQKDGDIITVSVTGNGFLYNMVRIITGTLVYVGGGKINADDVLEIIQSCDRTRAGITAPPQGLFMKEVFYIE